jgi:hypothetical protein
MLDRTHLGYFVDTFLLVSAIITDNVYLLITSTYELRHHFSRHPISRTIHWESPSELPSER